MQDKFRTPPFEHAGLTVVRRRLGTKRQDGLDVLHVKPNTEPEKQKLPLLLVPGYVVNANVLTMKELAIGFAEEGRDVHALGFRGYYPGNRRSVTAKNLQTVHGIEPDNRKVFYQEWNKAAAILQYIEHAQLGKGDILGHSLGALSVLLAVAIV